MEENWYWADGDKQTGPVSGVAITRLITDAKLGAEDLVWKDGMPGWLPVVQVPELARHLDPFLSPVVPYQQAPIDQSAHHEYVADPSAQATCPHCSAVNPGDAQYCETCGMAMPIPNYGPRIVDNASFAATSAGRQLQSEELHKQARRAAGALMAVAIIQTIFTVILVGTAANSRGGAQSFVVIVLTVIAAIFWGLYFWARSQPLPAAIVGLVLYVTLKVLDVVAAISQGTIGHTSSTNGIGGLGIGWPTIVIIVVLARAISAGLKYRKMQAAFAENAI